MNVHDGDVAFPLNKLLRTLDHQIPDCNTVVALLKISVALLLLFLGAFWHLDSSSGYTPPSHCHLHIFQVMLLNASPTWLGPFERNTCGLALLWYAVLVTRQATNSSSSNLWILLAFRSLHFGGLPHCQAVENLQLKVGSPPLLLFYQIPHGHCNAGCYFFGPNQQGSVNGEVGDVNSGSGSR